MTFEQSFYYDKREPNIMLENMKTLKEIEDMNGMIFQQSEENQQFSTPNFVYEQHSDNMLIQ